MIELRQVGFRYAGAREDALRGIDLRIARGTCVVLTGKSGCGKTTCTRLINGLIPDFYEGALRGEARVGGRDIRAMKIHEISDMVGSVFQDPHSQFFTTNTTSELAFACENRGMARREMLGRIRAAAEDLSLERLLDRNIFTLSGGERQLIAVGSVYAYAPGVYVFDEPSANLDDEATEMLRRILAVLKGRGCTLVLAEHRLHYLRDLADQVVVMADGGIRQVIAGTDFRAMTNDAARALGLRAPDLSAVTVAPRAVRPRSDETPALSLRGVTFAYPGRDPALDGVGFCVERGEIVGIVGRNGAGKSTLAGVVCGILDERAGQVLIDGEEVTPKERIRKTSFVLQDADRQLFAESVEKELLMGGPGDAAARAKAEEVMKFLDLVKVRERHPASLSGGQKQRVIVAVACMRDAAILVFDEPTSGLDLDSMRRTGDLFRRLAAAGKTILVITHDRELLADACTRVLRLEGGKAAELDPGTTRFFRG